MISLDDVRFLMGFGMGALVFGWLGVAIGSRRGFQKARKWYMEQDLDPHSPLSIDLFPSTSVGSAQPEAGGHHGEG